MSARFARILVMASCGLALSFACRAQEPAQFAPESILYRAGSCRGACPVYRVTISRNGEGQFEGNYFTSVQGTRAFRVTPRQFAAFASWLAPLRPGRRTDAVPCPRVTSDMASAEVVWLGAGGERQRIQFNFACASRNPGIASRLRHAPSLLPIAAMIGVRH